jgi:hypothetical protein
MYIYVLGVSILLLFLWFFYWILELYSDNEVFWVFYFINLQKLCGSDPQKWFTPISNNGCNKARFWLAEIWNKFDWLKYKKKRFLEFINLFEWFIWRMVPKFMLIQKWIWPLWENYPHFCSSLTFIMTIMHYTSFFLTEIGKTFHLRVCHDCDRMVVGFTTTYVISAYHH